MRRRILAGGPFSGEDRRAILGYCASDVEQLARLLGKMAPQLDLPRALLRGRYMAAAARIEWTGVPIDVTALELMRAHWVEVKAGLISVVDRDFGVFENGSFRQRQFADLMTRWGTASKSSASPLRSPATPP